MWKRNRSGRCGRRRGALVIGVMLVVALSAGVGAQECSVSIDSIAGAWYGDGTPQLVTNATTTTFRFRLNVSCDSPNYQFMVANAFVLSSPDGGDWGYTRSKTYADWAGFNWGFAFLNHFHKTGGTGNWGNPLAEGAGNVGGTDSAAVLFSASAKSGAVESKYNWAMPGGYNGVPYGIEIRPTTLHKHICIDSVYVPGGLWHWPCLAITHPTIVPNWYPEPQCYDVVCCFGESVGNIDMSPDGMVTMDDLTMLIDNIFITMAPLPCPEAANVDMSVDGLITMADATVLIDHLFITLAALPPCPN